MGCDGGEQVADDVVPDAKEEFAGEHHNRLGDEVGDPDFSVVGEPVPGRQGEVYRHLAQDGSGEVLVLSGTGPHDGGVDMFLSDQLRMDTDEVRFVRDFVASGKSVTSFCHGLWTLIEGGVANGRTLTSHPSIRTDLRNAGVNVVDEEMARDGNLITSHSPDDLPAFFSAIAELFSKAGEVP